MIPEQVGQDASQRELKKQRGKRSIGDCQISKSSVLIQSDMHELISELVLMVVSGWSGTQKSILEVYRVARVVETVNETHVLISWQPLKYGSSEVF
jgi:hypothetical protein